MHTIQEWFREVSDRCRQRLATRQADVALALLGLIAGFLAGGLIIVFRLAIESIQLGLLPLQQAEAYEALSGGLRFLLPFGGSVVLAVAFWFVASGTRSVGILHVLERLQYHEGHLPARNLITQFLGGIVALASGQSVGREGPSIHLGAGIASLTGQYLALPNNSIRTLVACGAAAAIAASFNTPLAGVVFAMEVIVMEYTIAGFTPVILAAVVATVMTRSVFGEAAAFTHRVVDTASFPDLVFITIMGIAIGAMSAGFVTLIRRLSRYLLNWPVLIVLPLVGFLVGVLGILVPEVLGTGYDTVQASFAGQLGIALMLSALLAKFLASAVCVAGRIPGGLIGPTIVMGSLAGGLYSQTMNLLPMIDTQTTLYAMLGMGAMMSATLQAPLAGLLALLEMTASPGVIMPAMLAIVTSNLAAKMLFGQHSVYLQMLQDSGLVYRSDPLSQGLRRIGVTAVMHRNVVTCEPVVTLSHARQLLEQKPGWIVIRQEEDKALLLPGSDLAACLENEDLPEQIPLLEIPGHRLEVRPVHSQATLYEAHRVMEEHKIEAVYVRLRMGSGSYRILGVLQKQDIEASYAIR